mmetsp:Transcript_112988/g.326460  ORF Transcript_112988/g.326460 Transcript_112988/m.326460 type:complete len:272 (-) Transcript_112988:405-1220(-)
MPAPLNRLRQWNASWPLKHSSTHRASTPTIGQPLRDAITMEAVSTRQQRETAVDVISAAVAVRRARGLPRGVGATEAFKADRADALVIGRRHPRRRAQQLPHSTGRGPPLRHSLVEAEQQLVVLWRDVPVHQCGHLGHRQSAWQQRAAARVGRPQARRNLLVGLRLPRRTSHAIAPPRGAVASALSAHGPPAAAMRHAPMARARRRNVARRGRPRIHADIGRRREGDEDSAARRRRCAPAGRRRGRLPAGTTRRQRSRPSRRGHEAGAGRP